MRLFRLTKSVLEYLEKSCQPFDPTGMRSRSIEICQSHFPNNLSPFDHVSYSTVRRERKIKDIRKHEIFVMLWARQRSEEMRWDRKV